MRKTIVVLVVIFTLLFNVVFGVQPLVKANPYYDSAPTLGILSPDPSWESCYSNASVPLKIGILVLETSVVGAYTPQVFYSLDNGKNITLTNLKKGEPWAKASWLQPTVSFTVSSTLYNLTEGNHTLSAYLISDGKVLSAERIFTVDSSYKSPELTLISPKKITYTTSEVELIFSTTKELKSAKYILDYHLDSQARYIFINGNITLTNLTNGTHKIILFADCSDKYHHGNSLYQGTSFNVSINTNTTKAENTTEVENTTKAQNLTIDYNLVFLATATVAVIIAVVCIGSIVYFKKRKRNTYENSMKGNTP